MPARSFDPPERMRKSPGGTSLVERQAASLSRPDPIGRPLRHQLEPWLMLTPFEHTDHAFTDGLGITEDE